MSCASCLAISARSETKVVSMIVLDLCRMGPCAVLAIFKTPSVSILRHRTPPIAPSVRNSAGARRCEGEDGADKVRRLLPSFSFSLIAAGCRYGEDFLNVLGIFLMILVGVLKVS